MVDKSYIFTVCEKNALTIFTVQSEVIGMGGDSCLHKTFNPAFKNYFNTCGIIFSTCCGIISHIYSAAIY